LWLSVHYQAYLGLPRTSLVSSKLLSCPMFRYVLDMTLNAISSVETPTRMTSKPRQDPVSCSLCRKKKLKCSRKQPCSNCVARGVEDSCDYAPGAKPLVAPIASDALTEVDLVSSLRSENGAIKQRLEWLEQAVYGTSSTFTPNVGDPRDEKGPVKTRRLNEVQITDVSRIPSPSTTVPNTPDTEATRSYRDDVLCLEGVGKSLRFGEHD